jgi:tetratricopeptide (TPR) repeat protein
LEDNPNGDGARVPLLKAAFETGDYHLLIAAVKPQLQSSALEAAYARREQRNPDEEESLDQAPGAGRAVQGFGKLPAQEWAEIARALGIAFAKTDDLDQALMYFRRAYKLETDPAKRTEINKEVQQIRAAQRRRVANLSRQPTIHTELEQDHLVRPRLGATFATKKGVSR